ncbi:MAG TPA: ribbon-helix-helix domain-containing protein [Candidatus Bathyarchaeia archaeon]|nr:ribbon-helix-helix domain-containing protein [Candidatus Bathyarchaeia archaeon]
MKIITLHIPEAYLQGLDELIDQSSYPNRAEAIRLAVRDIGERTLG